MADVNQDGKPDLIAPGGLGVAVYPGLGDGTFGTPMMYSLPNLGTGFWRPYQLAAVDLNGDGNVDIVVTNFNFQRFAGYDAVAVFMGNSDGTLQPAAIYPVGGVPSGLAIADFDNDGHLDILTADSADGTLSFLHGNGDGTFAARIASPAGVAPRSIAVADFNGDGNLDVVVTTCVLPVGYPSDSWQTACNAYPGPVVPGHDSVLVLLGKGDGTFGTPTLIAGMRERETDGPVGVEVADLNGDGHPDLVGQGLYGPLVLLGNGDGTFQSQGTFQGDGPGGDFIIGDFNGDGKLDFISVTGLIGEMLGNGDGTFQPAVLYPVCPNGCFFSTPVLATADVNQDGRPDLVIANLLDQQSKNFFVTTILNANGLTRSSTSVSLSLSAMTVTTLGPLTLTAHVNSTGPAPHGYVTFIADGKGLGAAAPDLFANAVLTLNDDIHGIGLEAGTHTITAIYAGDDHALASRSNSVQVKVTGIPDTVSCTTSPNPSLVGEDVDFSCRVTTNVIIYPQYQLSGTLTFEDGIQMLGIENLSGPPDLAHALTFTTILSDLQPGLHSLVAVFSGNHFLATGGSDPITFFLGNHSAAIKQVVLEEAPPPLSLAIVRPPRQSRYSSGTNAVAPGGTIKLNVAVSSSTRSSAPVALSCSGLPANTSCFILPSTVLLSDGHVTAEINVITRAPSALSRVQRLSGVHRPQASSSTPIGHYSISIVASSKGSTATISVPIEVQ